jgi:prolyl-tRNA editing enzyme YbaK/EbsC (Cys-tRNA(Pro) deacylase)
MTAAATVLASPAVERVVQALRAAGIDAPIVELPGAARTAKLAAEFLGCELGQIANSLVFRGAETGAPRTFVGRSLAAYADVWAAAGHPNTVFRLAYAELVRITGGEEIDAAT